MTKTIKLSLAAVMAAGIATTASAQDLSEAIKGVDVSGYVDYRLENKSKDMSSGTDTSGNANEYAVNVTLTSKVNDMVKATVSAGFDEITTDNDGDTIGLGKTDTKDTSAPVGVDKAYFTFDLGVATVMAGKQDIPSAFVDKSDTVKQGAGVVALYKVSDALTLAGAHFMNNNIVTNSKTSELIAMGTIANVTYAAHYNTTDRNDNSTESDRLFFKVGAKVSDISLTGKYATSSADATNGSTTKYNDASVMGLTAATKVAAASVSATYFTADKSGTGAANDVAIDSDNDAEAHVKVWQLSTQAITKEGSGFALGASMPVADKLTAGLTYAVATDEKADTAGKDIDYSEILAMVTYKMSKNLTLHARYSILEADASVATGDYDQAYSRLAIKYTF